MYIIGCGAIVAGETLGAIELAIVAGGAITADGTDGACVTAGVGGVT